MAVLSKPHRRWWAFEVISVEQLPLHCLAWLQADGYRQGQRKPHREARFLSAITNGLHAQRIGHGHFPGIQLAVGRVIRSISGSVRSMRWTGCACHPRANCSAGDHESLRGVQAVSSCLALLTSKRRKRQAAAPPVPCLYALVVIESREAEEQLQPQKSGRRRLRRWRA